MANDIDDAFAVQYEAEAKLAYQRMGPKFMGTYRTANAEGSASVVFQNIGKGAATTKGRNSDVTPMNPEHSTVTATLADYYAPQYIDKLDMLKIRHDERGAMQRTAVAALGRQDDAKLITTCLEATTNTSTAQNLSAISSTNGTVTAIFSDHIGNIGARDVALDDGMLFSAVSIQVWEKMLTVDQFARAEYVGATPLAGNPWGGRKWMGSMWNYHTGLTISGTSRYIVSWHKDAIGKGIGQDIGVEINYVPSKASWLVNAMSSFGYVTIDGDGQQRLLINEGS